MVEITLTQREYVALIAGCDVSDDEVREFLADYEDWLHQPKDIGDYRDPSQTFEAQPYR